MGNNQMKSGRSYTGHKTTRRRNDAARFQQHMARLGHNSDVDGRQAFIDLMAGAGTRIAITLYQSLTADGYEVPEHIRPAGVEKETAGSATNTPAVQAPTTKPEDPCIHQDTTDGGACQPDIAGDAGRPSNFYNLTINHKERQMLGLGEYARGNGRPGPLSRAEGIGPRRRDGTPLNNPGTSTQPPAGTTCTVATQAADHPPAALAPRSDPDPLARAVQAARDAFAGDPAALTRLEQAALLIEIDAVQPAGPGLYTVADRHQVSKHCDCIDHTLHQVDWCIHRLAVALYLKARQIEAARATAAPDLQADARHRDEALPADYPRGRDRLFKS